MPRRFQPTKRFLPPVTPVLTNASPSNRCQHKKCQLYHSGIRYETYFSIDVALLFIVLRDGWNRDMPNITLSDVNGTSCVGQFVRRGLAHMTKVVTVRSSQLRSLYEIFFLHQVLLILFPHIQCLPNPDQYFYIFYNI